MPSIASIGMAGHMVTRLLAKCYVSSQQQLACSDFFNRSRAKGERLPANCSRYSRPLIRLIRNTFTLRAVFLLAPCPLHAFREHDLKAFTRGARGTRTATASRSSSIPRCIFANCDGSSFRMSVVFSARWSQEFAYI